MHVKHLPKKSGTKSILQFNWFYITLFALLFIFPKTNQAQFWVQKAGGLTIDEGLDIAIDGSGNTYTTGYFTGTATFGNTSLVSSGSSDIFITKTNSTGNVVWAVKAGGTGSDRGLSIESDAIGNCYVTGYFYNTASFGTQQIVSSGAQDIFIAKYNTAGTLQWVQKAGGSNSDIGNGISVDNTGSVIVTGEFQDTASFGTTNLISGGASDVFITKLTSTGAFSWTQQGTGTLNHRGLDLSTDNAGNIYATGQFSGDITFDAVHTNTMYNAIYVIKLNSLGQELWFEIAGAGQSNIAKSIVSDPNGNCYITGDFTGNLTFFSGSGTTLTNTYSNRVFVAKYTSSGALSWASSAGSESSLSSNSISIDPTGASYIIGEFECVLDEFSNSYGTGTFNTVGFKDIYIAKFSTSGTWVYSKNIGSRSDDFGSGIVADANGRAHITGSFSEEMYIPITTNFGFSNTTVNLLSCGTNSPYCGDATYGEFAELVSTGNKDVIIGNCIDPNREPFDYYIRNGATCDRSQVPICIGANCPNTASGCVSVTLDANLNTCPNIGPLSYISWDSSLLSNTFTTSDSGMHYIEWRTDDQCFYSIDSIEVIIHPNPPQANITDDKGININSTSPADIELCNPDSTLLTAGGYGNNSIYWVGPGLPAGGLSMPSVMANQSGNYSIVLTDSNGCVSQTSVKVTLYDTLDPIILAFSADDTIDICDGQFGNVMLYDSLNNPGASPVCLTVGATNYNINSTWTISPNVGVTGSCETFGYFSPTASGLYTISVEFIRENACESDTFYLTEDVYINLNPNPTVNPQSLTIQGNGYLCPGDSTLLVATGGANNVWFGPGITGFTGDSIYVDQAGAYNVVMSIADTNMYGCVASYNTNVLHNLLDKPQPSLSSVSLLICPNDSVAISCSEGAGLNWEGPNGLISDTNQVIFVTDPGTYYVIVNDADSCGLVSNSITLNQYATPQLLANGDIFLCDGDSVEISVVSNDGSLINWLPPLSGNGNSQIVHSPGIYSCEITSCGITTTATMEVFPSKVEADISNVSLLCENDSILLIGSSNMFQYTWYPTGDTTPTIFVSDTGLYALTTLDSSGCEAQSDTINISFAEVEANVSIDVPTTFCSGDSVILKANSGVEKYLWNTNDTLDSIMVYQPGTYSVTTTDTNGCQAISDEIELFFADSITDFSIDGDLHICENDSVILTAETDGMNSFLWSPGNQTTSSIKVIETGTYSLMSTDTFGCRSFADSIDILVEKNNLVQPNTGDTLICSGLPIILRASTANGDLVWYDYQNIAVGYGNTFIPPHTLFTATYFVYSESTVCKSEPSPWLLEIEDCTTVQTSNVLTPNGDGINDLFSVSINGATCFNCKIYNRWGTLIYELKKNGDSWDGRAQQSGELVVDGTYFYLVDYCGFDGNYKKHQGYITVIQN